MRVSSVHVDEREGERERERGERVRGGREINK